MTINISNKEYYRPWSVNSSFANPWDRQYLNVDFCKYESRRIKNVHHWVNAFNKAETGSKLESVEIYCISIKMNKYFRFKKVFLEKYEGYKVIGLSALYNSLQEPILAIVEETKVPADNSLIEIIESKKRRIMDGKTIEPLDFIEISEYNLLPPDKVLVDVPVENNYAAKIISENLIDHPITTFALQAPLISSPLVHGELGGIGLTSFTGRAGFNEEVVSTLIGALPPFYSSINPPKTTVEGRLIQVRRGLSYRVSEKIPNSKHWVEGITRDSKFNIASRNRMNFNGEYSILSNFNYSSNESVFRSVESFGRTEVFLPYHLDYHIDKSDLKRFTQAITEDFWLQIAHARQLVPRVSESSNLEVKYENHLKGDFDVLVTGLGDNQTKKSMVNLLVDQNMVSLIKNAKALARSEGTERVQEHHFRKSRDIIVDTFYEFWEKPGLNYAKEKLKHSKNLMTIAIRTVLSNKPPLQIDELWKKVSPNFPEKRFNDLFLHLEGLRSGFMVFKDSNGGYSSLF